VSDDPEQRFSELYGALYGRVRAYAARRVGADAADEVAAETFTIAWRRFEAIPAEPLPWLYGVARNVVARHWTGEARQAATRDAPAAGSRLGARGGDPRTPTHAGRVALRTRPGAVRHLHEQPRRAGPSAARPSRPESLTPRTPKQGWRR
jgi:DNA-directed RNA polymerase specialized sigma24 family protein